MADLPNRMRFAAGLAWLIGGGFLSGCAADGPNSVGDPQAGATVIARSSCGSCHQIPGIGLADGRVGPSLASFGRQQLIAGTLPNSEPNLILWLRHPRQVRPHGLMPDMGLTEGEARDVAAYLYQLQ